MIDRPTAQDVEALSLIQMGDENEPEFISALLYMAFCSVLRRPNATLPQIIDDLEAFGVDEQKAQRVLAQLTGLNAVGAGCVSKWKVPKSGAVHYNVNRKRCFDFECWMDKTEEQIPALKAYRTHRYTVKPSKISLHPSQASLFAPNRHSSSLTPAFS